VVDVWSRMDRIDKLEPRSKTMDRINKIYRIKSKNKNKIGFYLCSGSNLVNHVNPVYSVFLGE
jgi:hypothetical protein